MSLRIPAVIVLLGAVCAAPATAVVIDDFEAGEFCVVHASTTSTFFKQTINAPGHCIDTERTTFVDSNAPGAPVSACLTLLNVDDGVVATTGT